MLIPSFELLPGLMAPGTDGDRSRGTGGTISAKRTIDDDASESASFCLNMRPSDEGGLEAVRRGTLLARSERRLVIADRRDDDRNFLSIDDDLTLRLEIRIHGSDPAETVSETIATLPAPPAEAAVCGEFLVVRLADDRLFYLLWHADERRYSALGLLPEYASVTAERVAEADIPAGVAATKFSGGAVSDLREGDPDRYAAPAGEAVAAALRSAIGTAALSGYWSQPVSVRVAWRLWDGTLLHVSEPTTPAGFECANGGRVALRLTTSDKGYTGTTAGTLTLPVYRLSVSLSEALPAAWHDVVSAIEIWVSEEPDPADGRISIGVSTEGAYPVIGVTVGRKTPSVIESELRKKRMELTATLAPEAAQTTIDLIRQASVKEYLDPTRIEPEAASKATAITGHGDWLHLACGAEVSTTRRGNPFVRAGRSASAGGRIAAMAAQPMGGGAYTRQYLYLFTDRGVAGLTHDQDGRHRNLRLLSASRVTGPAAIASTPDGIFAIDESGSLLRLRDASVSRLCRGLREYDRAVYERRHNELWIFRGEERLWVALTLDGREPRASVRDMLVSGRPCECGGRVYLLDSMSLRTLESPDGELADIEWTSFPSRWRAGGLKRLEATLFGEDTDITLQMWRHSGRNASEATMLAALSLTGPQNGRAGSGVLLPPERMFPMSISISGKLERLTALTLR